MLAMMNRHEHRDAIRKELASVRNLLSYEKPGGMFVILQDVGQLEDEAQVASDYEMFGVREKLRRLMEQLKQARIITPERFEKYFVD